MIYDSDETNENDEDESSVDSGVVSGLGDARYNARIDNGPRPGYDIVPGVQLKEVAAGATSAPDGGSDVGAGPPPAGGLFSSPLVKYGAIALGLLLAWKLFSSDDGGDHASDDADTI